MGVSGLSRVEDKIFGGEAQIIKKPAYLEE